MCETKQNNENKEREQSTNYITSQSKMEIRGGREDTETVFQA